MKFFIFFATFFLMNFARAIEVISVDQSTPLVQLIQNNCPWVDATAIAEIVVLGPQKIGWSGGKGSKLLGNLFESTGINANPDKLEANLPENTRALFFNVEYYNNNKQAQVIIDDLYLVDSIGNKVVIALSEITRTLSQSADTSGESILLCFTNDESFLRVSTTVTHNNVDGSRPKMGITAVTSPALVLPTP